MNCRINSYCIRIGGFPLQLTVPSEKTGVTVTCAVMGELPMLIAVNEGTLPVPPAPRPIDVLLFDQ